MRMMTLAFHNFKNSFRNYLSVILSLAFTILIFLNFQNILASDAFAVLGERNRDYIDILVQMVSFVLGCFMFFFIWYATNVFLTKRKKEIGIYVFMGLTNERIGVLYMIETVFIGLSALVLGILVGMLTTGLFQMILLAISDIAVEIHFQAAPKAILVTAVVYLVLYLIFVGKGYLNILRSSVLDMISASRRHENTTQKKSLLLGKAVLGLMVLGSGYYLSVKDGGQEVMAYALAAVVLVTVGVYLLFGGLIPLILSLLQRNKGYLYHRQRCLWINNLIFRMKRNYRTYAMVCVLVLCAVSALATGFAVKNRYDNITSFENKYTFQLIFRQAQSAETDQLAAQAEQILADQAGIAYRMRLPLLMLPEGTIDDHLYQETYGIVSYADLQKTAEDADIAVEFTKPAENEVIGLTHMILLSLISDKMEQTVGIGGQEYQQMTKSREPFLGYLQESMSFLVVNEEVYEKLCQTGEREVVYSYKIQDDNAFTAAKVALDEWRKGQTMEIGRVALDPENKEIEWFKILYSLCIFMFLVFILASGSIMFMKQYNDAFEEKEQYQILHKMGVSRYSLRQAVRCELAAAYTIPFVVMTISSWFAVHALAGMMQTNLFTVNVVSVGIVLGIFVIFYGLSVSVYQKNAGIVHTN